LFNDGTTSAPTSPTDITTGNTVNPNVSTGSPDAATGSPDVCHNNHPFHNSHPTLQKKPSQHTSGVGTQAYAAPEQLTHGLVNIFYLRLNFKVRKTHKCTQNASHIPLTDIVQTPI
jgi:hypothetical protein